MIVYLNPVTSQLVPDSVAQMQELRHWFSIPVKGAYFAGSYGHGKWDGRKYYVTEKGSIATGMLPMLGRWAEETGTEIILVDQRPAVDLEIIPCQPLEGIEYRDYQEEAVERLLTNTLKLGDTPVHFPVGVYDLATNAGKTLIAYNLHRRVKGRTLLLISSRETYKDLVRSLSKFTEVGEICSTKLAVKDLTICMSKTLLNRCNDKKFLKELNLSTTKLIVDEGHEAGGRDYMKLLKKLNHPPVRLLMSGTPFDQSSQVLALNVMAMGGEPLIKVSKRELMDRGISLNAKVRILKHVPDTVMMGKSFREIMELGVLFSESRRQIIVNFVNNNPEKYILISVKESRSGQFIYEGLKELGAEVVHASDKDRDEKVDRFRTGDTKVLISTMMIKQGVNMPLINAIVMAFGGKDILSIKQVSGRGERTDGYNDSFEIVDFLDDCDYLREHSQARIKAYIKEEFEIEFDYAHDKRYLPI